MENFEVPLVVGPLRSWPDEWLERAARLCSVTLDHHRAGALVGDDVASLEAELANFVGEQRRRQLVG